MKDLFGMLIANDAYASVNPHERSCNSTTRFPLRPVCLAGNVVLDDWGLL